MIYSTALAALQRNARVAVRRTMSRVVMPTCLMLLASNANAETAALSGKVNWGDREICKGSQGRMLVFSGDGGKAQAPVAQDGYYSVKLEPGRYRVTLKCGGSDIKTVDVIGYPSPTQQDLTF
jgi:hypothetical protein